VGKKWDGSVYIDVQEWATLVSSALVRLDTLWIAITTKYPRNLQFWTGKVDVELE
jgi:hypothetical protein